MSLILATPWGRKKPPRGQAVNPISPIGSSVNASWMLNENGGKSIFDASLNEHNGTINTATWSDGKFGRSLKFNGTSDYASLGASGCGANQDFTCIVWFNTTASGATSNIFYDCRFNSTYTTGTFLNGFWLGTGSGKVKYRIFNGPAAASFGPLVDDGLWHQAVLAASHAGQYSKLYVDGIWVGTTSGAWTTAANTFARLGVSPDPLFYSGSLDNVTIVCRELLAKEVQDLFSAPFAFMQPQTGFLGDAAAAAQLPWDGNAFTYDAWRPQRTFSQSY